MSHHRIQKIYYLITSLSDASIGFAFGTYSVFLQSHGLTPLQMNMVNATFMFFIILMEVPTGSVADAIGRRRSVILGALFTIIGSLTYFLSGSIGLFIIAEFLFATGAAFESGALDAWAVDGLLSRGYTGKTEMVFSRAQVASKTTLIGAGLLGSYIAKINLNLPFLAGTFVALVSLFVAIFFMEEINYRIKSVNFKEHFLNMKTIIKTSFRTIRANQLFLYLFSSGVLLSMMVQPLNMFWGPRVYNLTGNIEINGWAWALFAFGLLVGSALVQPLVKLRWGSASILLASLFIIMISAVFAGLNNSAIPLIIWLAISELGRGMDKPARLAAINRLINNQQRATILSAGSMFDKFGAVTGLLVFGLIANYIGYGASWVIAGIGMILIIPIYLTLMRKMQSEN